MRVLRNARLVDGRNVDLRLDDSSGTIAGVTPAGSTAITGGAEVDDLDGWLLLPAMAEPHAHLDKALTADEVPNPKGDLMGAIE
ncbi:MAG: cytosine deaminase, partial [Acidimicrobiaceae bacterium]|nr:cytosine deaminase [Acidimicrobiaceae bacterium]